MSQSQASGITHSLCWACRVRGVGVQWVNWSSSRETVALVIEPRRHTERQSIPENDKQNVYLDPWRLKGCKRDTGMEKEFRTHCGECVRIRGCSMLSLQSCPTLWDPMDHSPQGSFLHEILQTRILEWVAISFSRGSSRPRDQTQVSCTGGRFFTVWGTREARGGWSVAKLSGFLLGHRGALQGYEELGDWNESHVHGPNVKTWFWRHSSIFLGFPYGKTPIDLKSQAESSHVLWDNFD